MVQYNCVLIGCSAGGFTALKILLTGLNKNFSLPIIIIQHVSPESKPLMDQILQPYTELKVNEGSEKEPVTSGNIYIAPANYHLLLEENMTLSLSADEKVAYSRPSIDVCFESASFCENKAFIAVLLTGANRDGSEGMKLLKKAGSLCIVQDPDEAEYPLMPKNALKISNPDYTLSLKEIIKILNRLEEKNNE